MRMGQGVRTGLGHGGITCVLQTPFSSFIIFYTVYAEIFAVVQFSRYFAVSMKLRKLKSRNIFLFLSKNRRQRRRPFLQCHQ